MAEMTGHTLAAERRAQSGGSQAPSIKHPPKRPAIEQPARFSLPDFRNLGAVLRIIVVVNIYAALIVLVQLTQLTNFLRDFLAVALRIQLPLLLAAFAMYGMGPWLLRVTWRELVAIMALIGIFLASVTIGVSTREVSHDAFVRSVFWVIGAAAFVSGYFRWRQIEQTPALDEARILALTARIRPHFFFNSLNGVLGVMRSNPKRAEVALESLAELFRELMKDNRDLVTLCDEIELCNRYLELEKLRLGDRLQVQWELKYAPLNAKVPPLMLQPLLENAVYHGIEPSPEGGTVAVRIVRKGNSIEIAMTNPSHSQARRQSGNKMALANIRERLELFFDMEASLTTEDKDGQFRVRIRMPLRREGK